MSKTGMNRRQFLQSSGLAGAGVAAVASGAVIMAPDGAWALSLNALTEHEAMTLLVMTRQCYPHDSLGDMYYAEVVDALDADAAGNADTAKMLKDGVAKLDGAMGIPWLELSDGHQVEVLKSLESDAFFQAVRGKTVVALYNNPLVWRFFGYEGPSAELGGYFDRGFNDLAWLPDPPEDASPSKA